MGCNCKKVKQVKRNLLNNNIGKKDNNVLTSIFKMIGNTLLSIINAVVVIILIIGLAPIVSVMLIFSYLKNRTLTIDIPQSLMEKMVKHG